MLWLVIIGGLILVALLVLFTAVVVQEFGGWLTLADWGLVVVVMVWIVAFNFGVLWLVRG